MAMTAYTSVHFMPFGTVTTSEVWRMIIKYDIAKRKLELMRDDIRDGSDSTKPWLDLDVDAYRA